jgi:hypothetical protein
MINADVRRLWNGGYLDWRNMEEILCSADTNE